jgi:hypothetical protein
MDFMLCWGWQGCKLRNGAPALLLQQVLEL